MYGYYTTRIKMMVFESYVCVFRLKLYHNGQEELRVFIGSADSCIFVWFLYENIFDTLAYKYEYYFYTFIEKKFEKYIVKTATKNYEIMDTQKSNILSTSSRFVFVLYFYVTAICVFHVGYYNKVEGQLTPGKYVHIFFYLFFFL